MHAVIVDGDVTPTSGKRLRTLNLVLRLASGHQLTYIGRCHRRQPDMDKPSPFLAIMALRRF